MRRVIRVPAFLMFTLLISGGVAHAQIYVNTARLGCLDSPTANEGNLTAAVQSACNGKYTCSYKAPDPNHFRAGHTKPFCTQAMEIKYRCGNGPEKVVKVPGDAWNYPAAPLSCEAPPPPPNPGGQNPRGPKLGKISLQEKERIFGNPQSLQQKYAERFKTAAPQIQKRILAEQEDIRKRGKRYTVSYTSVSAVPANKILLAGLPPILKPPLPQGMPAPPPQPSCLEQAAQPTDPVVDMRDYGIVTAVRNQGGCGSCWTFGTTAALETSVLLKNGSYQGTDYSNLALSEEQILSCTGPTDLAFGIQISADDCGGGLQPSAASYTEAHSIVPLSAWPYSGAPQGSLCSRYQNQQTLYKTRHWDWICYPFNAGAITGIQSSCFTPTNQAIKQAIVQHGSVIASMYAGNLANAGNYSQSNNPTFFLDYAGGVYDENNGAHYGAVPQVDHIIQMVGWDDTKGAWLIKNSWGTDWGEGGFGWIAYNTNNIGSFAIWLDAEQYNNACAGPAPPTAKLKAATIKFDNLLQGKASNAHYWVYLHKGPATDSEIMGYSYTTSGQGDYSTGKTTPVTLNMETPNPPTYQDFVNAGTWNLQIDFHANFGGLQMNSDWKTNVYLNLIFDDGRTTSIMTPLPIFFHGDKHNAGDTWRGVFQFGASNPIPMLFRNDPARVPCQGGLSRSC